jgi:hypothetical protein
MNIINNIYKENLNILINRKSNEIIKFDDTKQKNLLIVDNSYYSYYFNVQASIKNISTILQQSFNKHFILISIMNNMKFLSSQDYCELNYNEYKANIIKFIETSIDGINRLILDNKDNKDLSYLLILKENCEKQLQLIKTTNIDINLNKIVINNDEDENSDEDNDEDSDEINKAFIKKAKKVSFDDTYFSFNFYEEKDENKETNNNNNNFIYNIFKNVFNVLMLFFRFMY